MERYGTVDAVTMNSQNSLNYTPQTDLVTLKDSDNYTDTAEVYPLNYCSRLHKGKHTFNPSALIPRALTGDSMKSEYMQNQNEGDDDSDDLNCSREHEKVNIGTLNLKLILL